MVIRLKLIMERRKFLVMHIPGAITATGGKNGLLLLQSRFKQDIKKPNLFISKDWVFILAYSAKISVVPNHFSEIVFKVPSAFISAKILSISVAKALSSGRKAIPIISLPKSSDNTT